MGSFCLFYIIDLFYDKFGLSLDVKVSLLAFLFVSTEATTFYLTFDI